MPIASEIKAHLPRIIAPTLLIAGTHYHLRPPTRVRTPPDRIPHARFAELDTGHFMPVQTPDLVAGAIVIFLRSVAH